MNRPFRWSRWIFAVILPLVVFGAGPGPVSNVRAVGCGDAPQLAAPAVQSAERWRYSYDGAGSYELIGWTPTEATVFINAPGCALSRMGVVELNLLDGSEMWRLTTDQLQGSPEYGFTTGSGLVILSTTKAVYAFDETTGQQMWVASHAFDWAPMIVSNENNVIALAFDNELIGLAEKSGVLLWHTMLQAGSIADWEDIAGGPLIGLGRPDTAGQDVQAFGVDKTSGSLLWQTSVGQTVSSTGGMLNLAANRTGLVAAEVLTDGTMSLAALDGATGAIRWTVPITDDSVFARMYVTGGAQPVVIYASGNTQDAKTATAYDGATGALRWQNQSIGADAILADDTHLVGAGPAANDMNALVLVDGETGEMLWAQPYALVDGGFSGAARVWNGSEIVFTPAAQESAAPRIVGIDLASGNVAWEQTYPEFSGVFLDGIAAGLVLVTGETATEAVMVALAP